MTKSKLLDLADRVEALTSADREVDAEIAVCVLGMERDGNVFFGHPDYSCMVLERSYYDIEGSAPELPAYTASLDSAMSLVPPRHNSELRMPAGCRAEAYVWAVGSDQRRAAKSATPALALTAACLRARAQAEEAQ